MSDEESDPVKRRATAAASFFEAEEEDEGGQDGRGRRRGGRSFRLPSPGVGRGTENRGSLVWATVFTVVGGAIVAAGVTTFVRLPYQRVFVALGGASVFVGLLTYALRPTGFPRRDAAVFGRTADNVERLAAGLGLSSTQFYVPTGDADRPVRLFVPRDPDAPVPSIDKLSQPFVGQESAGRLLGLALDPTGLAFQETLDENPPDDPTELAGRLCGILVDRLEVAEAAQPNVDTATGRATVVFRDPAYGSIRRFDHPARSFVGVGLAVGLDRPIRTEVVETADGNYRIRYRWETR